MACTVVVFLVGTLLVTLFGVKKTKLKIRYPLLFGALAAAIVTYQQIPACARVIHRVANKDEKKSQVLAKPELKYHDLAMMTQRKQMQNENDGQNVVLETDSPRFAIPPAITDPPPLTVQEEEGTNQLKDDGPQLNTLTREPVSLKALSPELKSDDVNGLRHNKKNIIGLRHEIHVKELPHGVHDVNELQKYDVRDLRPSKNDVIRLFHDVKLSKEEKANYIMDRNVGKPLKQYLNLKDAAAKYDGILPEWDLREMSSYPRIWFVGASSNKIVFNASDPCNFAFDLCKKGEGKFRVVVGDHIEFRYEVVKKLGSGSFGTVVEAYDHAVDRDDPNHLVAIKIIHNDTSAIRYFKQELDMMKLVEKATKSSPRFSTTLRTFYFRNHLCFVLELLGDPLEGVHDKPLEDLTLIGKYAKDIFEGLVLLHENNIIHGDMKPENLMFSRNCGPSCPKYLKIVDYNLACVQGVPEYDCPGVYFQTRLYRAPEVIMDLVYDTKADIWSVGVILAELVLGKVPFYGETSVDQLAAIMEVLGLIPPYMVESSPRINRYQEAICYKCKNGFERVPYRKPFVQLFEGVDPILLDLIRQCLKLDPRKRISAKEALRHQFLLSQSKTNDQY